MTNLGEDRLPSKVSYRASTAILAMAIVLALTVGLSQSIQAQTYTVLHNFTGGNDSLYPLAGLTMDQAGNLYGTTQGCCGGIGKDLGSVYKLTHEGSSWVLATIHKFAGYGGPVSGGAYPYAGVVFGPDGSLYGTTDGGGFESYCAGGCGTVFKLRPPAGACNSALCPWVETILYRFSGPDGAQPRSEVVFDQAGNLYGTTAGGGQFRSSYCRHGCGTVFKLTPSGRETVLYSFGTSPTDGILPQGNIALDASGNIYGATEFYCHPDNKDRDQRLPRAPGSFITNDGEYCDGTGTIYQLTASDSGWTENTLYVFQYPSDNGWAPEAGLTIDQLGNLYGTASGGGINNGGVCFELTLSNSSWVYSVLYPFTTGSGPASGLTFDTNGNLYGTTVYGGTGNCGGEGCGTVFKLVPSGGSWTYVQLHDFTGVGWHSNGGAFPYGAPILDANGNVLGTTYSGGAYPHCTQAGTGCGVVWEITP